MKKIISALLFIIFLNSSSFGFSEAEFRAEQKQFDKDLQASQEKFDKEFKEKRDKFNEEFESTKKEAEFQSNLVIGFIISMFLFTILFNVRKYLLYKKIPLVEKYVEENQFCKTDNGIECKHCGSKSLRSFGLFRADDTMRTHICNSCGKTLYRSNMTYV